MRSRTATWFDCKVRYNQTQGNGSQKAVTEQYVVDALSFAEAEARITEQISPYISGDFEVTDVKKAAYKEIFFMSGVEKMFNNEVEELSRAIQKGDNEKAIESAIVGRVDSPFYIRRNIVIPNVSWGFLNHEADLLVISQKRTLTEIEIKRTWADFMDSFPLAIDT